MARFGISFNAGISFNVTKYYLKAFDHFSKSFLNFFKLDILKEKLANFNIWLNNIITYVF